MLCMPLGARVAQIVGSDNDFVQGNAYGPHWRSHGSAVVAVLIRRHWRTTACVSQADRNAGPIAL